MSQYEYEVIRWPFSVVAGTDADLVVRNVTDGVDHTQAIPPGIYINDGSGSLSAPLDFAVALQATIAAALTALGVGGTISVSMGTAGELRFSFTGLTRTIALKNLTAQQIAWIGVAPSQIVGGLFEIGLPTISPVTGTVTCLYQASHQWHPMMDSQRNTSAAKRQLVYGAPNMRGQERRVVRSASGWLLRVLRWDFLPSGVILTSRAADANYAQVAGVTQGEDNTWEAMWEYLLDVALDQPYGDNRVYLYEFNDPSTAVRSGPWEYILEQSLPSLDGVELEGAVANMGSEYYPVRIVLRTQQ